MTEKLLTGTLNTQKIIKQTDSPSKSYLVDLSIVWSFRCQNRTIPIPDTGNLQIKIPLNSSVLFYFMCNVSLSMKYLHFDCTRLRWKYHSRCSSFPDAKHLPVMWSRPHHRAEERQCQPIRGATIHRIVSKSRYICWRYVYRIVK